MNKDPRFNYHARLPGVAQQDVATVLPKDIQYGASWKRRGGVGAYMMLTRKWDRIENALDPTTRPGDQREAPLAEFINQPIPAYDIITAGVVDTREEGLLDDIRDLRRYLLILEAEILEQRHNASVTKLSVVGTETGRFGPGPCTSAAPREDDSLCKTCSHGRSLHDRGDLHGCTHGTQGDLCSCQRFVSQA